ncbi:MAG: hypothetical protein ACFE8V_06785 [Promethearchaeota archaeon]
MKTVVCKECGFSIENKEPGVYYCENCLKKKKFFKVQAFCGEKPDNKLYKHN